MLHYPCFINPCEVVSGSKPSEWITVVAPATTANVGIGFDCLGFALKNIEDITQFVWEQPKIQPTFLGDIIHLREGKGPEPIKIIGVYKEGREHPDIPTSIYKNVIGRVAEEAARHIRWDQNTPPLEMILEKMKFAGSGMGSSAASVVATAYATLLALGYEEKSRIADTVVRCEVGQHPDNVLPSLLGGFIHIISMNKPSGEGLSEELMALREAGHLIERFGSEEAVSRIRHMNIPAIDRILNQYDAKDFHLPREAAREGEKAVVYRQLIKGLEEKAEIRKSKGIIDAIEYLKRNPDSPLLDSIENIRSYPGMDAALIFLRKIETREQNRVHRIFDVEPARQEYLSKLINGRLSRYIRNHSKDDLDIKYRPLEIHERILSDMYVLIIKPDVYISTVEARRLIKLEDGKKTNDDILTHTSMGIHLVNSLREGDIRGIGEAINHDRISEPVRGKLIPGYFDLKKKLVGNYGLYGLNISGSGSACFGITDHKERAIEEGRKAIRFYKELGIGCDAFLCMVDTQGARRLYPPGAS